ncbi:flavin-containing monooxygenase [Pseudovibrio brasiliensis]|uniref:Trimethylamine monooxygenase n=1 Tax=Pseudovibrio brasiliensis TaxID=1898042 RepID=A0ABX8AQH1_9HYPH|nr:NAD(P)/FAD-dependent oxidoreductase [Pseudovibrio brasiliensis]QUS57318.1 NAD(P)/FAD-dependent oxidoreductase [Pseudovibrio brasiliensis]
MVKKKKVAVIGGGVSGLAAAKAFDERGHRVFGYERTHDFGGVWELSRSYPGVQTQSPKDLYCYTDLPMPDEYPEWPKGPQVHAYLHSYARKHKLHRLFQLNTSVLSMDRREDGQPGWTLTLDAAGQVRKEDFDFVVISTGQFSEKNIITHPGQEAFEAQGGAVMHSSDYTDPSRAQGKRVVVLGGSKSATDVAVNAAQNGASQVTLVYREPVWRVPYFVGGINFKRLLYMRAQELQFNSWGRNPLQKAMAALAKPFIWANFRGLEMLLKMQLGLKKWDMVPKVPIEKDISCSIPIVTPGLFEGFKSGKIKPVQGTIDHYEGDQAVLTTGDKVGCDVSVLAVGWKLGIPYLAEEYRNKLIEDDGQYRTYRLSVNPDLPEMGFVGFNSSFCTVLSAEMIANWLVRYADGQLANQPSDTQMRQNIDEMLDWRRDDRPAAQVYGGLCSAPFHFKHFDELLRDIGAAKRKRSNPLAEQFSYPNAQAYGSYLKSAPQYFAQ